MVFDKRLLNSEPKITIQYLDLTFMSLPSCDYIWSLFCPSILASPLLIAELILYHTLNRIFYFLFSDCETHFGKESLNPITRDDSVICNTEYSKIVPLEGGEVNISYFNLHSKKNSLLNHMKLTDVKTSYRYQFRCSLIALQPTNISTPLCFKSGRGLPMSDCVCWGPRPF